MISVQYIFLAVVSKDIPIGPVSPVTRSSTLDVSNPSSSNYNATTAGAIARQQERYLANQLQPTNDDRSSANVAGTADNFLANQIQADPDPIGDLYSDLLGREADSGGRNYWTDQLQSGNQTLEQIRANIMRSAEYQNK